MKFGWPNLTMLVGLTIAAAGFAWNLLQTPPPMQTYPATESETESLGRHAPPKSKLYYSKADKDEIANAFLSISKILESQGRPVYKLGNDLLFAWGRDKDPEAAMAALSDYQQQCRVLAADLDRIYSQQFSNYQEVLEGVLAFDGADPVGFAKDRAGDLYADVHDINEVLAKKPDAPKDTLVGLAHRAGENFQQANTKLRAWTYETKDRIEAAKAAILVDK